MRTEDLLHFVSLDQFEDDWAVCGLEDDDLGSLQLGIMGNPKAGSVIPGTGGVRKLRFAGRSVGKRGGVRVLYTYFEELSLVVLIMAYGKGWKENITAEEAKGLKACIKHIEQWLGKYWRST